MGFYTVLRCGIMSVVLAGWISGCAPKDLTPGGTWKPVGERTVNSLFSGEGVASRGNGSLLFRGLSGVPLPIRAEGFPHIGDADIADGMVFDAYQNKSEKGAKLFLVTTSKGRRIEYRHPLDPGERFNNSFVTISPDHQWMISGEFGAQNRLQVFPAPLLNHSTPPNGGNIPQVAPLALDPPVTNVQGCDFFSPQRLVCTSDDSVKHIFRVDLPRAIDGKPMTGKVSNLFLIPQISRCHGKFEAEGIDYNTVTKLMEAEIASPGACKGATGVFSFRWVPDS